MKNKKVKNSGELKVGDKVWWYHSEALWGVIDLNATHAHVRNAYGVMEWVPLETLRRGEEAKIQGEFMRHV